MKQWFKDCLFDSSDMSFNEIYERLLTIDMNKLLKSSKNLRCLFHNDHNPSASIFTSKTGHSIFIVIPVIVISVKILLEL